MLALFRLYKVYYVLAFSFILVGLVSLLFLEKGEMVLALDSMHTPMLDYVFLFFTLLGEEVGGLLVLLALAIFAKRRYIAIFIVSAAFSLIVSQGFKHLVFENEGRPASVYPELRPVKNLERHKNNSFPSGHTTAAFTFFTILALGIKKRGVQVWAPLVAVLVGVSRVYLGQHYLNDIVAGAVIGLLVATVTVLMFDTYISPKNHVAKS